MEEHVSVLRTAYRLSIYLGNADIHQRKALSGEILHRAHRAGHSSTIHRTPRWSLRDRTPITVHLIDTPSRIRAFLPQLDDLANQCLIVFDEVQILSTGPSR